MRAPQSPGRRRLAALATVCWLAVPASAGDVRPLELSAVVADAAAAHPLSGRTAGSDGPFRYVDVFTPEQPVRLRLPLTATRPIRADLYLVKARDAHGWRADPRLEEVRGLCPAIDTPGVRCTAGAPPCRCELAAGGDTPPAQVITVAGPGSLSADAPPCFDEGCLGLGAGYDVVLDRDLDGRLSPPDLIDGAGDRAGFYMTRDPDTEVLETACADYAAAGTTAFFDRQRLYWPANPGRLESIPLVVISHGAGHDYGWYGYLQRHLAAQGYAVMSHQNQTRCSEYPYPGCTPIGAASEGTLRHTDVLLGLLLDERCAKRIEPSACTPGGDSGDPCSLVGRIDRDRIVWIGHSRGGTGAVWARNRLLDGDFVPAHFGLDDVKLIGNMAPTDKGIDGRQADPGDTPYHLVYGSADNDVGGRPGPPDEQGFQLFERSTGVRHADYLHGVGHGWFHDNCRPGGDMGCDFTAEPRDRLIGVEATHRIVRSLYVPLLAHYLDGDAAAEEFFWRPWATLRPPGEDLDPAANPLVRVVKDYRPAGDGVEVIDDHQSDPLPERSSAGTRVRHDLDPLTLFEGALQDDDCTFDWDRPVAPGPCGCFGDGGVCRLRCSGAPTQPMNGMTRSRDGSARGVVLEWPPGEGRAPFFYEVEWPPAAAAGADAELSLRLAQMPRHPNTMQLDGEIDLQLTLIDQEGRSARLSLSALETRLHRPYPRPDSLATNACTFGGQCGVALCCPVGCNPFLSDLGWQVEFATVRLRLADFAAAGRIDVERPAAVRLEFGGLGMSPLGRIAVDDLLVVGGGR